MLSFFFVANSLVCWLASVLARVFFAVRCMAKPHCCFCNVHLCLVYDPRARQLVSLGGIGTDTGRAGCRWMGVNMSLRRTTHTSPAAGNVFIVVHVWEDASESARYYWDTANCVWVTLRFRDVRNRVFFGDPNVWHDCYVDTNRSNAAR